MRANTLCSLIFTFSILIFVCSPKSRYFYGRIPKKIALFMQIKDILSEIERFAPLSYQESYDNSGVQVGNVYQEASAALLCLDVTEAVVAEALNKGCNLIIAHHPLIFSGLKSITGKNYIERVVLQAIKHDLVIYAAHTNLDNVQMGVNRKIAERLSLQNTRILSPVNGKLYKLFTYVPSTHAEALMTALFAVGAGSIGNYDQCSFQLEGKGTFRPSSSANPHIGVAGGEREKVSEWKLEFIVPEPLRRQAINVLKANHPYEEVAYELIQLENEDQTIGAGIIGQLETPLEAGVFLRFLQERLKVTCIRHTAVHQPYISTIALCGGSGSFLLPKAIGQGADAFVTADYKYHQFFDAEQKILIADIGHYESEQFTIEIFSEILKEKFPNFALLFTEINTNPVNYFF
jgi:dinuclear metal center YbgI/SA1388 family protein